MAKKDVVAEVRRMETALRTMIEFHGGNVRKVSDDVLRALGDLATEMMSLGFDNPDCPIEGWRSMVDLGDSIFKEEMRRGWCDDEPVPED